MMVCSKVRDHFGPEKEQFELMKNVLLSLSLLIFALPLLAEGPKWETDFEAAKIKAAKENKSILVNFSGSDWCGWCKKLDREVFRKKVFQQFAAEELVLVQLDFPRYKRLPAELEQNNTRLLRKFGVQGFPTVLLIDSQERILLRTGYYPGGPDAYIKHLQPHIN